MLPSVTPRRSGSQSAKSLRLYCRDPMSQFRARVSMMLTIVLVILLNFNICESYKISSVNIRTATLPAAVKRLQMTGGFGSSEIPKPKIITPSRGKKNSNLEKFLMMYTCKICDGRNAQMVSKVAYNFGMVVSSCKHCKNKHLIADNEGKMDMGQYGKKIEEFLESKGEVIQRLSISTKELEDNYLIDKDGVITLVPKISGQPSVDSTIVDLQIPVISPAPTDRNGQDGPHLLP